MYSTPHQVSTSMNSMGGGIIDGSGTINPAALNSAAALTNQQSLIGTDTSPRGLKRSRSPETYGDLPPTGEAGDDNDDSKPRKRGRPPKTAKGAGNYPESPNQPTTQQSATAPSAQAQTPQAQSKALPPSTNTPTQASPPKATPAKAVVKALPTVRDHTTDQLGPEGDEYLPRESDEAGERKVNPNGHPLDGREYKCRTFFVPNRHDKLFMLATECARVLGYRDSYLLFNKNRSLYKIIATQAEKDDLIHQEILPYSYRSRQIAIVTAKSMFRQFGSRVIVNGRRVRDDYWESKAKKQGFTEEDLAGEKRPGAAKARDAAAAEAASAGAAAPSTHTDIVYSNGPAHLESHLQPQTVQPGIGGPAAASLAPLPMILPPTDDMRVRDYGNVPRPRQEISGQPYQDRTTASATSDMMNHAQHTAEFNKALGQQRGARGKYIDDFWSKPREPPVGQVASQQAGGAQADVGSTAAGQPLRSSPQLTAGGLFGAETPQQPQQPQQQAQPHQQAAIPQHQSRGPPQMINQHQQAAYSQQQHQHNPLAQSPIRSMPQGSIRPDQMHHRSPSMTLAGTPGQAGAANPYGNYSHHPQMWPPSQQAHQSPLSQSHHPMATHYSPHAPQAPPVAQHQSPHQHHQQQPGHPAASSHQGMAGGAQAGLQYGGMSAGMAAAAGGAGGYHPGPGGVRGLYQAAAGTASPAQQHFMQQQQAHQQQQQQQQQTSSGAHVQPGMQGWAPPQQGSGQQGSPHGSGGQWGWGSSG